MTSHPSLKATPRMRLPAWFHILLVLDAFAAGGLMALELVRQLLDTIMQRSLPAGIGDLQNVWDHLFPTYLIYVAAIVALGVVTIGACTLLALSRREQASRSVLDTEL